MTKRQIAAAAAARDEKTKTKLQGLSSTLEKTDRILSGRPLRVFINPAANLTDPPASSDGETIKFNESVLMDSMAKKPKRFLLLLLGLNYHELAHTMYSPRQGTSREMDHIQKNGLHMAWNMLEDQRIEALFAATYGSASKFLTAPVTQLILDDKNQWGLAHLLTHGRRYLPIQVRTALASRFSGSKQQKADVERIIDSFRKLDYLNKASDAVRMVKLVEEFHKIITDLGITSSPCSLHGDGGFNKGVAVKAISQDASRRQQEQDEEQEAAEEAGEDGSQFWPDREDPGADDESEGDTGAGSDDFTDDEESDEADGTDSFGIGGSDGDEDDTSGSGAGGDPDSDSDAGDGAAEGSPSGRGASSGEDEADDDEDLGDSDLSSGSKGSGGGSKQASDDEIENLANEVLDYLDNDEAVQREITQTQLGMDDPNTMELDAPLATIRYEDVTEAMRSASEKVGIELRRLYESIESGWNYGTDHGRLNVGRAMQGGSSDEWFDSFEEGHELDAGLEAMFLLDRSGSMGAFGYSSTAYNMKSADRPPLPIVSAARSLWIIKRALDQNEATTSAFSFDDDTEILYKREEEASPLKYKMIAAGGSTDPMVGLREARRILNGSQKPNKVLFIITDGQFDGGANLYLDLIGSIDAIKVFIGIDEDMPRVFEQYMNVHRKISDASQVVEVVQAVVEEIILNAGR
jgi:hypothetical protein